MSIRLCIFSALLLYGIMVILLLCFPAGVKGAELPLKEIVQAMPLPDVGGTAQLEVRKKHWRLFQPPKWRHDEMIKQGLDPRWRYGPVHYLEIKFLTKPEWKK